MDELIKDTLNFIKQEFQPHETVLASPEDFEFFNKKQIPSSSQPVSHTPKSEIRPILEPSTKPAPDPMEEMRQKIAKAAPQMKLRENILDDTEAKKIANMWQEHLKNIQVAVLSFGENGKNLEFLNNVAKAIDSLIAPAKVIDALRFEKEKKWQLFFESYPLKLILAPDIKVWKSTDLAVFYKENPTAASSVLGKSPLLFIQPIGSYLKNPKEKRALWKAIVSQLSS